MHGPLKVRADVLPEALDVRLQLEVDIGLGRVEPLASANASLSDGISSIRTIQTIGLDFAEKQVQLRPNLGPKLSRVMKSSRAATNTNTMRGRTLRASHEVLAASEAHLAVISSSMAWISPIYIYICNCPQKGCSGLG